MSFELKKQGTKGCRFLVLDSIDGEPWTIVSRATTRAKALDYIKKKTKNYAGEYLYFIFEAKHIEAITTKLEIKNSNNNLTILIS